MQQMTSESYNFSDGTSSTTVSSTSSLNIQKICKKMEKLQNLEYLQRLQDLEYLKRYNEYMEKFEKQPEKFTKDCFSNFYTYYKPTSFDLDKVVIKPQLYGEEGFILTKMIENLEGQIDHFKTLEVTNKDETDLKNLVATKDEYLEILGERPSPKDYVKSSGKWKEWKEWEDDQVFNGIKER